jgi:hypothetical protein
MQRNLADQLRDSLQRARGDARIRERLRELSSDPNWLESITAELGARHGLVRELLSIARTPAA